MPSISAPKIFNEYTEDRVSIPPNQIKNIAIIGGGASGAVALDSLLKEQHFDSITLFERRDKLGGVWCLDEKTIETPNNILKAGYTHVKTDPQLRNPFHESNNELRSEIVLPKTSQERFEETPSYQGIKTNIIEKMMTYSDVNSWNTGDTNPEASKYVNGLVVQQYIDDYIKRNASDSTVDLQFNTTVEDVERITKNCNDGNQIPYQFKLTIRKNISENEDLWFQQTFDSIVISIGHYHVPFIPKVDNLDQVQSKFPSVVQHAKFYRNPTPYSGKKVIVVGSRASGADLSKFIADTATEVYQSIRNLATGAKKLSRKPNVHYKPIIKNYQIIDDQNFKVIFDDDSEVLNPDHIIYCTGYQFSFPFLNRLFEKDQVDLTKEGIIIPNLYQHTFLIHEPLINFIGVPIDGVSFRVFEYQAVLLSRFLTSKISLPSRKDQKQWILERLKSKGITRAYHTIGVDDAFVYLNGLVDLGEIKNPSLITGRHFPSLTQDDLAIYRAAGEKLREFWDER